MSQPYYIRALRALSQDVLLLKQFSLLRPSVIISVCDAKYNEARRVISGDAVRRDE